MLSIVVAAAASLALGQADVVSLAAPDFSLVNVNPQVSQLCSSHLGAELSQRGVRIITNREISSMIGLERQKALLGCSESSTSCQAELAAALGTDGLLLGDLGKLGKRFQIVLKVINASSAQVITTWTRTVDDEGDLLGALTQAANELAPRIKSSLGHAPAAGPATGSTTPASAPSAAATLETKRVNRRWPLIPSIVAGGLALIGGACWSAAGGAYGELTNTGAAPGSVTDPGSIATRGQALQWAARIGLVGAGVAIVTAAVLFFMSGEDVPVSIGAAPTASGLSFALGGSF